MQFFSVVSSNVAAVGYDASQELLGVLFKAKAGPASLYVYSDVPKSVWDDLKVAPSVGSFVVASVRKFPTVKLEGLEFQISKDLSPLQEPVPSATNQTPAPVSG